MKSYSVFAEYYDRLTDNVGYPARAEYLAGLLARFGVNGGLLLDLACGTGSLSLEFAKRGFEVIGVDASPEMLCVASEKSAAEQANVLFLCQKMQRLDLYGTIDAAICTLDSLNHLTRPQDVRSALRRVSLFLNPGGIFLFDVNTLYKHEQVLGENTFVYDLDDVYCVWQNEFNAQTRTTAITLDFFVKDGESYYRSGESFSERAYSREEWHEWLKEAGLEILAEYRDMTCLAPEADTQRVLYAARKI